MIVQNIKRGSSGSSILQEEMDKSIARFDLANIITDRIEALLAAAPEIFNADRSRAFGKLYTGEIQIAVHSVVDNDESITKLYAIEDEGIAFTAERKQNGEISSVFISSGRWPEKFEKLENSVREAHCTI